MAENFVIQMPSDLLITLEKFHAEQIINDQETITIEALKDLAGKGRLPGAFRHPNSKQWWINKLAAIQQGIILPYETTQASATEKRERGCSSRNKRIQSQKEKKGEPPSPRYNS